MGVFQHEAACVDPDHEQVYLSEDVDDGGLYRFTPTVYPDLSAGLLEIACAGRRQPGGVEDRSPTRTCAARRRPAARSRTRSSSARGEGIWFDSGFVYLVTTTDETIHVYDTNAGNARDRSTRPRTLPGTPLPGIDNILVTEVR